MNKAWPGQPFLRVDKRLNDAVKLWRHHLDNGDEEAAHRVLESAAFMQPEKPFKNPAYEGLLKKKKARHVSVN